MRNRWDYNFCLGDGAEVDRKGRRKDNLTEGLLTEDMKKHQLTEDMAQYLKFRMSKIMSGPAEGDGQER